jgi:excisionase family DNA binding protein
MTDQSPLLLSPERVSERLDMGRTKVYQLIATGELESVKIGRSRRVPADAVHTFIGRLREQVAS